MLPHLLVKKLNPTAIIPTRGTPESIGLDLYACQKPGEYYSQYEVRHGEVTKIHTGIAVKIPPGYYGRIAPRSGLAASNGIQILAGVIDSDYRGEIIVLATRAVTWGVPKLFLEGERVAQLILERADLIDVQEVDDLDDTVRGAGGFGSTGDAH